MSSYKHFLSHIDFGNWVHPSVADDVLLHQRHRAFIKSQALGGGMAACLFSAYVLLVAGVTPAALIALVCFSSPLWIAVFLSRSGRLEVAHLLSAANLAALVVLVAALSGGMSSFAVVWLILVPLEAATSADRRITMFAALVAGAALIALYIGSSLGAFPQERGLVLGVESLAIISNLAAGAYALGLAVTIQNLYGQSIEAVEESRADYSRIARNTSDLITQHDADGGLSFASLRAGDLFAKTPEQLIEAGMESVLAPQDRERFRTAMAHCATSGERQTVEFCLPEKSAAPADEAPAPFWIEMSLEALPQREQEWHGEKSPAVLAITRDISLRIARDVERKRALMSAEAASEAKSRFIATMSHELRTPLNAIIGFAEFLHRELLIKAREPRQADYCRIIHESGEHLLSVVNDMLDVSKIEAGKLEVIKEPFDMGQVTRDVIAIMGVEAQKKKIDLRCNLAADLPELVADRRACKQMLLNLLSNACKFTPEGGNVSVTLAERDGQFSIDVVDSGIGIAPADIERLGEAFFQVDSRYARRAAGSGLGLSIVKGMAELHGGNLTIKSKLGKGTKITVSLPNHAGGVTRNETAATLAANSPDIAMPLLEEYEIATSQENKVVACCATGQTAGEAQGQLRRAGLHGGTLPSPKSQLDMSRGQGELDCVSETSN